jgi:nitronate monooxygenase
VTEVLDLRDLTLPVVGAPMAGGPSTAALAAAVSEAGGIGFLAAGYQAPEAAAAEVGAVRAATTAPWGLNLFVVDHYEPDPGALDAYRRALEPEAERLGVDLGQARWDDDWFQAKIALALDARPDVLSFTFGCPSREVLAQLAARGVLSSVTVTSVAEALVAVDRGAASLCVQGPDAGGHRGTWDLEADPDPTPLLDLLSAVAAVVDVPIMAGGGISDADGVRAVLERGAVAAQIGTAYLLAEEAGTNGTHRAALKDPALPDTALTRAYTGRWARGLANRFMADHVDAPAGYPHIHHLTSSMRKAAAAAGDLQVAHLWAGTGQAHARAARAADITRSLAP